MTTDAERALLREIHYDLAYFGEDSDTQKSLVAVIAQLPDDVRRFALERCRFVSVGRAAIGLYLPEAVDYRVVNLDGTPASGQEEEREQGWLVVFYDDLGEDDLRSVIAHEIAHLWLGHEIVSDQDSWLDDERKTSALVSSWGFVGKGADASDAEDIDAALRKARR